MVGKCWGFNIPVWSFPFPSSFTVWGEGNLSKVFLNHAAARARWTGYNGYRVGVVGPFPFESRFSNRPRQPAEHPAAGMSSSGSVGLAAAAAAAVGVLVWWVASSRSRPTTSGLDSPRVEESHGSQAAQAQSQAQPETEADAVSDIDDDELGPEPHPRALESGIRTPVHVAIRLLYAQDADTRLRATCIVRQQAGHGEWFA